MSTIAITIVTACAALFSAALGAFVSFKANERKIKAALITANRQRWMEIIRELLAELMSVSYTVSIIKRQIKTADPVAAVAADHLLLDKLEHVALVKNKIRLMLNPTKKEHHDLYQSVDVAYQRLVSREEMDVIALLHNDFDVITQRAHVILGHEWLRVKRGD